MAESDEVRQLWDGAAPGWRQWSDRIDAWTAHVSARMVKLAGVGPGSVVLDVACGYGEPALTAARAAGPAGRVVATDISAEMLAYARVRADAAGMDTVEFLASATSDLDFAAGEFDAVISRWGVVFDSDAEAALARIGGFAKPGARVVLSSWGEPPDRALGRVATEAALAAADRPPPRDTGVPYDTAQELAGLLESGGCSAVDVEPMDVVLEFATTDSAVTYLLDVSPSLRAVLAAHPPAVGRRVRTAVADAVGGFAAGDGSIRSTNVALLAAGTV